MSFEIVDTRSGELSRTFHFSRTGLDVEGAPSFDTWQSYGYVLAAIQEGVLWALGDWWLYGEHTYGEAASQAAPTGYALQTCKDAAWVADRFESSRRRDDLPWTYHKEVAALPPEEQDRWLDRVAKERLTREDLRAALRLAKRDRRYLEAGIGTSGELVGQFRVIYADPPWEYTRTGLTEYGHADTHYPCLSEEELCALPIKEHALDDAVCFLWTTTIMLPQAFRILTAWGFEYKAQFIWDKVQHNFGHYNSVRHEILLLATRGSCTPDARKLFDSVQSIERTKHSRKPEEFRQIIDTLYPIGPRVELFARTKTDGWSAWTNQSLT